MPLYCDVFTKNGVKNEKRIIRTRGIGSLSYRTHLEPEIAEKKHQISFKKAPEGSLFVHTKGHYIQFGLKSSDENIISYLSKNETE